MGRDRKPVLSKKCPWSLVVADPKINQWLTAYGLIERWGKWPPGREDPQLLEAVVIIASEHSRMDAEKRKDTK